MTRYSLEPRIRKRVKGYGFLSFARNLGSKAIGKQLIDTGKDALKTASKRVVQKTAEATGDLVGSKIADKITSKKVNKADNDITDYENISPEKRQQIINDLRLV